MSEDKQQNQANVVKHSVYIQGEREKLAQCIEELKLWVKMLGIKQRNEANMVKQSISNQKDRKKLYKCIAALRIWVKVSEDKQKNRAKIVKNNACKSPQEYCEESDSKVKDILEDDKDSFEQDTKYFEEKLEANQR